MTKLQDGGDAPNTEFGTRSEDHTIDEESGGAPGGGNTGDDESLPPDHAELLAALHSVERQTRAFHTRTENHEQIIRQMQNRIERLQGDQVQALLKPVIRRLAGLHAQAAEAAEQARARNESAEKDFGFFAVAIEETLGHLDIESVGAAVDAAFDPVRHHAARVVPTDDPALDRRVQRVLRQGFTYTDAPRVFLPAQVSVYRYEPPQDAEAAGAVPE